MIEDNSCGREPFALRVIGDSMEPEFKEGCIIIIDPEALVSDGCYVVAKTGEEYAFRQLVFGEGVYFLRTLNSDEEDIEIASFDSIEGVIIQQAGRRRSERKHYT